MQLLSRKLCDSGAIFALICCDFSKIAAKLHQVSNIARQIAPKSLPVYTCDLKMQLARDKNCFDNCDKNCTKNHFCKRALKEKAYNQAYAEMFLRDLIRSNEFFDLWSQTINENIHLPDSTLLYGPVTHSNNIKRY